MTQTIKPATPLPWSVLPASDGLPAYVFSGKKYTHTAEVAVCYGMGTSGDDIAAYIVKSANAYPRLVEALRDLLADSDPDSPNSGSQIVARNLLRELGGE